MVGSIIQFFYPDIKKEEIKKFGLLALALFFVLGTYWILRLLKDVLIYELAFPESLGWPMGYGREFIPTIKLLSPFVVIAFVMIYTKLIDIFEKHKLFYVIISFYVAAFSVITAVIGASTMFGPEYVGKSLFAATGVGGYLITESYGSLVIAMFWSFTVSSTKTDEAKRGFPFMIAFSQIATIGGSALVFFNLPDWSLFVLCLTSLLCVMGTIYYLVNNVPKEEMVSDKVEKKSKPDFLAGIRLLLTRPYLMGVLVVSTFYEVAKTVVDYQMKSQAAVIPSVNFKQFLGMYGVSVNFLAFVMALLGTSTLMKKFGIRFCLALYPVMFGTSLICLYLYYQSAPTPEQLLWATFIVMMIVTATSYAVNNPVKEMMYIPTSKDAKFKAKGIVDMIGGRSAKMSGAQIGGMLNVPGQPATSIANLMGMGTLISLGVIGVWLLVAIYVGQKNAQLVRDGETIE